MGMCVPTQVCQIPFTYQGNTYADCMNMNGTNMCKVPDGTMQVRLMGCTALHRALVLPASPCAKPRQASMPALHAHTDTHAMYTCVCFLASSQECAPLIQRPLSSPSACRAQQGAYTPGGTSTTKAFKQCVAVLVRDAHTSLKTKPSQQASHGAIDSCLSRVVSAQQHVSVCLVRAHVCSVCVLLQGTTMCRTMAGSWVRCAPPSASRVTLSGQRCQVPYSFGGWTRTDCVLDPTSPTDREVG